MSSEPNTVFSADAGAQLEAIDFPPLAKTMPTTSPAMDTAQDLLDWVLGDPLRNKNQRSNEAAAIKWLGKVDGTPLSTIPLEVRYLVDDRFKRIRQHKPINKLHKSGIITLLNRVLRRAGILMVGSRRGGTTSHAWTVLIDSIPGRGTAFGHGARVSLSSIGKFCSERQIEPPDVTLAVWDQFADETLYHSSFKRPRATLQKTLLASNSARLLVPAWPLPEFPKLVNPRSVSIPKDDLPASFWADIEVYVSQSSTPAKNLFDMSWPKQLAPDTLQRYREVAWRTASAQVHEGRPASEITSLAALLHVTWLEKAMTWFFHHAGDTFLKDHLNMAATWVSFADNYVHPPAAEIDAIRKGIFKVIEEKLGPVGFSQKNIEKLEQFSSPAIVDDFLFLPYQILAEMKKKPVITIQDAKLMMAAVAIEILLTTMVRRKNLADIDLKKHFWPAKPTAAGDWSLAVDPAEVKNKQPLRFAMSKQTIGLIDFYLKKCRPLLLKMASKGKPSDLLFLPVSGKFKGRRTMIANLVSGTIRKRLGLDINVHLFRHIGTMLYLDAHPGDFGVPKLMLGHTSDATTQKFYAHLQATKAIKHFTAAVLGARNDKITKLKLA